ncbi:unnamed protein product [Rotaria socialis]
MDRIIISGYDYEYIEYYYSFDIKRTIASKEITFRRQLKQDDERETEISFFQKGNTFFLRTNYSNDFLKLMLNLPQLLNISPKPL